MKPVAPFDKVVDQLVTGLKTGEIGITPEKPAWDPLLIHLVRRAMNFQDQGQSWAARQAQQARDKEAVIKKARDLKLWLADMDSE